MMMTRPVPDEDRYLTAVQTMTYSDITQTAELHIAHLPNGFFPQLGNGFVRRWHRTFIDARSGVALTIRDGQGDVAAFLLGTTDQHSYVREVLDSDRFALAWRGAHGLLTHPRAGKRFVRTRATRYARRLWARPQNGNPQTCDTGHQDGTESETTTTAATPGPLPVGVVHAIVTRPPYRGRGYGRLLLNEFESELVRCGTAVGMLVTNAHSGAANFYRRRGWQEAGTTTDRDGREVIHFERYLDPQ
jgi:GNAT superfamily N-acetyltransferase